MDGENKLLQEKTAKLISTVTEFEQVTKKLIEDNTQLIEKRGKTSSKFDSISQQLVSTQQSYDAYLSEICCFISKCKSMSEATPLTPSTKDTPILGDAEEYIACQREQSLQYEAFSKARGQKSHIEKLGFLREKQVAVNESSFPSPATSIATWTFW